MNTHHVKRFITVALLLLALGCSSAPPQPTGRPVGRLSVLDVFPEPSVVRGDTKDITFHVNYAISDYDDALAPYSLSIQLERRDGFTVGPAFGPSNAVVSHASGQVRLVLSVKEVLSLITSDGLVVPVTAYVIVDHATKEGSRIIGKSGPIRFPLLGGA